MAPDDVLHFWYGDGYQESYRAKWFPDDGVCSLSPSTGSGASGLLPCILCEPM